MVKQGVIESTTGTIPEKGGQTLVSPTSEGKTPESVSKVSPTEPDRTYTQQEVDRLLHVVRSEEGRERKAVELERDHFKAQAQSIEGKLTDNAGELAELQKQIEKLSSNDPELMNLTKEKKELLEERRKLNTRKRDEEATFQQYAGRIKKAESFELEVIMQTVAEEYEDGDFKKLKALCETLEIHAEDKIRAVAETLFSNKAAETSGQTLVPKPFTGGTSGGGTDFDGLSPREKIDYGLKQKTKK